MKWSLVSTLLAACAVPPSPQKAEPSWNGAHVFRSGPGSPTSGCFETEGGPTQAMTLAAPPPGVDEVCAMEFIRACRYDAPMLRMNEVGSPDPDNHWYRGRLFSMMPNCDFRSVWPLISTSADPCRAGGPVEVTNVETCACGDATWCEDVLWRVSEIGRIEIAATVRSGPLMGSARIDAVLDRWSDFASLANVAVEYAILEIHPPERTGPQGIAARRARSLLLTATNTAPASYFSSLEVNPDSWATPFVAEAEWLAAGASFRYWNPANP